MSLIFPTALSTLTIILAIWAYLEIEKERLLETVTNKRRGTTTERKLVIELLRKEFPANAIFHDLYLPTSSGHFSQIDLVLCTEVGLIVFEVKNISGWIFGSAGQQHWTQVLDYGNQKYRMYNPILQNKTHITHLQKALPPGLPMFSAVVIYGDAEIRTPIQLSQNTYLFYANELLEIVKTIKYTQPALFDIYNPILQSTLRAAVLNGDNPEIVRSHIEHVRNIKNINTPQRQGLFTSSML